MKLFVIQIISFITYNAKGNDKSIYDMFNEIHDKLTKQGINNICNFIINADDQDITVRSIINLPRLIGNLILVFRK